jgi:hypothetical protein
LGALKSGDSDILGDPLKGFKFWGIENSIFLVVKSLKNECLHLMFT